MDFTFSEEQEAVREAAATVFTGLASDERVRTVEGTGNRFDRELWGELARADLLGIAVPEDAGGGGLGMVELCLLLEEQGRHVAPVPLWATLVLGALPLARFGLAGDGDRLLTGVVRGDIVLTAALTEVAADVAAGGPGRPGVEASPAGDGWLLSGTASAVPWAHVADRVLVPAYSDDGGVLIAVVDPQAAGIVLESAETTNHELHPHLHFDAVPVSPSEVLGGGPNDGIVDWMLDRAWTGMSAVALGVCESAVERTARYLNERVQFGRPLSSFQGTMLRAADAAIDTEAMRVTLWQAAWRLDAGLDAAEAVTVARWWSGDGANRVVHAAQHLHGGMGADVDYPIHRYFLWGKQLEVVLGGPSAHLARLGRQVVAAVREGREVQA